MNVGLLFNSDHPKFNYSYGDPIRSLVFGSRVIQKSKRHMQVSVGDVLIYGNSRTWNQYDELTNRVYFSGTWSLLLEDRLRATFRKATVYALVFENMTTEIAVSIHETLRSEETYLGLLEVDFSYGPHLTLFRNSMIPHYRVLGDRCSVFYSMGEEDGKDESEIEAMKSLGYTSVEWEDRGARKTIFDDFDTLEHFRRVATFRSAIAPHLTGNEDDASELVMLLEDLNPKLFDSLGAAVQALDRAQTEEDVAQASLSGRRYFERLADTLFPARDGLVDGRKVGKQEYKNRIWAFLSENSDNTSLDYKTLGTELDRLIAEFNAGLHSARPLRVVMQAFVDTAMLTAAILSINPSATRQPYLAYENRIIDFLKGTSEKYK